MNIFQKRTVNGIEIVTGDVEASNGVIHVIDELIIPPLGNLFDLISQNPNLSQLKSAVEAAGLQDTLQSGNYSFYLDFFQVILLLLSVLILLLKLLYKNSCVKF